MSKLIQFTTESGSEYEVDISDKYIRRVYGKSVPTPRMSGNLDWKKYDEIHLTNRSVFITWAFDKDMKRNTITSPVVVGYEELEKHIPQLVVPQVVVVVSTESSNASQLN